MNVQWLGQQCLMIAQQIAPFDTGNLAFNAITVSTTPYEIVIHYLENVAPYVEFLEDGTSRSGEHVGFISQDTTYAISRYIGDLYSGRRGTVTINTETLAIKAQNNPARNELFLKSIEQGGVLNEHQG